MAVGKRSEPPLKGRLQLLSAPVGSPDKLSEFPGDLIEATFGLKRTAYVFRQLGAYDALRRDPRGPVVSVGWWTAVPPDLADQPGGGNPRRHTRRLVERASDGGRPAVRWIPVAEIASARLAFEQARVVRDAAADLAERVQFTNIATQLCPTPFSMAELRRVYEVVWGVDLDPANFHRKVTSLNGMVEATGQQTTGGPGRPAVLYRGGPLVHLISPFPRPR